MRQVLPSSHGRAAFDLRGIALTPLLLLASAPALADAELAVRLSAGEAPGTLDFTLINRGDAPVTVLRTDTPLDVDLAEDAFDVRRTVKGWPAVQRAAYSGRLYKRAAPEPDEFVQIRPGEALSNTVPLADHYAVANGGGYVVRFDGAFATLPAALPAAPAGTRSRSPSELVEVRPDAMPGADRVELTLQPDPVRATRARPPAFNGCSAGQQNGIVEAIGAAEGIASESLQALLGTPVSERPGAPRYARWFGPYTADRYAVVTDRFDAISGALSGETVNADCTCTEDLYAYVFPNEPYTVYLCPLFFAADVLGTDSRAGTLVHELSHFRVLGGTRDSVYGQSSAAALALDDPDLAVANADSIEYFAENTPTLSMSGGAPVTPSVDTPEPPAGEAGFANLPLDTRITGFVDEGDVALYRAFGADTISLSSVTGDADLYVFADASLSDGSFVCSSEAGSGQLDVCELPSGDVWYVAVVGFSRSDYEITAAAVDTGGTGPGNGPSPTDDDPFAVSGGGFGGASGDAGTGALGWGWAVLLGGVGALRRAHRREYRRVRGSTPAHDAPPIRPELHA